MRLRRYKKKKVSSYFVLGMMIIILSLILAFIIIDYFSKRANEILLPMAESQVRKVITTIINSACDEEMIENDLYFINKNNNDEIEMITYNSFEVTKLINKVTLNIEETINLFEQEKKNYYNDMEMYPSGVIAEIPFGVIFGNSLLSQIGPKIKIRLEILGDVMSNIETEVKPYGINSAYVEMRMKLEVGARIVLPFANKRVIVTQLIPISMNVVQGTVPDSQIYSYK